MWKSSLLKSSSFFWTKWALNTGSKTFLEFEKKLMVLWLHCCEKVLLNKLLSKFIDGSLLVPLMTHSGSILISIEIKCGFISLWFTYDLFLKLLRAWDLISKSWLPINLYFCVWYRVFDYCIFLLLAISLFRLFFYLYIFIFLYLSITSYRFYLYGKLYFFYDYLLSIE